MADSAEGCSSYDGVNAVLRGLHAARSARAGAPAALAELAPASGPVQQDAEGAEDAECLAETLRFGPQDVVLCSEHGPRALCTRCCGFAAGVEVPRAAYDAFCRAYSEVAYFERPAASEMRQLAVPVRGLAAGEVLFAPFAALVRQLGPRPGELFLDLGSGTGRAVVAWALLQPRCRARGVEIRAPLHAEATAVRDRLPREAQRRVELLHGDLFHAGGWGEADVFLVNSTGFDEQLMGRVADRLAGAKDGARAVTLSQPLPPPVEPWTLDHQAMYRMSWGNATAFIYTKKA